MQHGSTEALRTEIRVLRRDLTKWREYALSQERLANVAYHKRMALRFEEYLDETMGWDAAERLDFYRRLGMAPDHHLPDQSTPKE